MKYKTVNTGTSHRLAPVGTPGPILSTNNNIGTAQNPVLVTSWQTNQPVIVTTNTSTIQVTLQTDVPNNPRQQNLLVNRFNTISNLLQAQGVSATNITMTPFNASTFGQSDASLGGVNRTTFNINTTTSTGQGNQVTTTTTTTKFSWT